MFLYTSTSEIWQISRTKKNDATANFKTNIKFWSLNSSKVKLKLRKRQILGEDSGISKRLISRTPCIVLTTKKLLVPVIKDLFRDWKMVSSWIRLHQCWRERKYIIADLKFMQYTNQHLKSNCHIPFQYLFSLLTCILKVLVIGLRPWPNN